MKAESCGDCGTYLKILYQEKDPKVEAVADDLASLVLDARMEQEGFARSSINVPVPGGRGISSLVYRLAIYVSRIIAQ